MEKIKIISLAQPIYKKCECCNRVKDVFYKLNIFDSQTGQKLVGDIDFCKSCGENFSDIMHVQLPASELVITEFKFE